MYMHTSIQGFRLLCFTVTRCEPSQMYTNINLSLTVVTCAYLGFLPLVYERELYTVVVTQHLSVLLTVRIGNSP